MENNNVKQISEIHLIRHSITEGNQKRWLYGAMDIPLVQAGIDLIGELRMQGIYPCLNDADENSQQETTAAAPDFYTSGMKRAEQTFEFIYGKRERRVIKDLREINFGIFEGFSGDELQSDPKYIAWKSARRQEVGPPDGESVADFCVRIKRGFDEVSGYHSLKELSCRHSKKEAHSVIVCHGGVIGALMWQLFPQEKNNFASWIPDPAHGYSLTIENGKPTAYRAF